MAFELQLQIYKLHKRLSHRCAIDPKIPVLCGLEMSIPGFFMVGIPEFSTLEVKFDPS